VLVLWHEFKKCSVLALNMTASYASAMAEVLEFFLLALKILPHGIFLMFYSTT
jgi:hypothetical protein